MCSLDVGLARTTKDLGHGVGVGDEVGVEHEVLKGAVCVGWSIPHSSKGFLGFHLEREASMGEYILCTSWGRMGKLLCISMKDEDAYKNLNT